MILLPGSPPSKPEMVFPPRMTLIGTNGQGNLDIVRETEAFVPETLVGWPHIFLRLPGGSEACTIDAFFFEICRETKPKGMVSYSELELVSVRELHCSLVHVCYYAQKFLHYLCFADAKNTQLITPRMVVDLAEQMMGMFMFYNLSKSDEDIKFVDRPCVNYGIPQEAAWEKELMMIPPIRDGELLQEYCEKVVYVARRLIQSVQDGMYWRVLNFTVTWVESHTERKRFCSYNGRWEKERLIDGKVYRETSYATEVQHDLQDSYLRETVFELKPPRCECCLARRKAILEV